MLHRDPSHDELLRLYARYLWHLAEDIWTSPGYRVLNGAEDLLRRLSEAGVLIGVISGVMEGAAHLRMQPGKLNRYFIFGAYGSDSPRPRRTDPPEYRQSSRLYGHDLTNDKVYVVGDTRRDIEGAHAAGATGIGVASGHYDADQLQAANADYVLGSLTESFPSL